tara:strand:+ start:136 stop:327 length:192 start_codon:yes stop_codon:yes gene_type:complete
MKFLLNAIGSLFVYRSPEPYDGFRRYLRHVTNYELRKLAGTQHSYNKTMLINMIIDNARDKDS